MRWLRAALAAALLIAPNMSARMAAEAPPGAEARVRAAAPATRFSELAEITPGNVSGLMPLVRALTRGDAARCAARAVGSSRPSAGAFCR